MKKNEIKLSRPILDIGFLIATLAGVAIVVILVFYARDFLIYAIVIGVFIYVGLGLPRWINRETRIARAFAAKQTEKEKWGLYSRDREGPWINYVDYPVVKNTPIAAGKRFYSEWLIIHESSIIVNPGASTVSLKNQTVKYDFSKKKTYAWDGCTPKRFFFWFIVIGAPDWWQKLETISVFSDSHRIHSKTVFWQLTLHASLIHDALYQYLDNIPIAKRDVDMLFFEMLINSGCPWLIAKLYHLAVRYLGARNIKENDPKKNSQLEVTYAKWRSPYMG